jgi:hypothetical protein
MCQSESFAMSEIVQVVVVTENYSASISKTLENLRWLC